MSPVDVRSLLERANRTFEHLVEISEELHATGLSQAAALSVEFAAKFAWYNHPGCFGSPRLERILQAIGSQLDGGAEGAVEATPRAEEPARVLHVLTRAAPTGGHTRLVWRWIQLDRARTHAVVLTRQRQESIPPELFRAVHGTGGLLESLDVPERGLMERAVRLREVAKGQDLVILHVDPSDPCPGIALSRREGRPPVVFLNQADHLFWLGGMVSDTIACLRPSGLEVTRRRRGLETGRGCVLPIPLIEPGAGPSRTEAREVLGLPKESTVLLTIGEPYKLVPFDEPSLAEAMGPVLLEHPGAILLAVGPESRGVWQWMSEVTGGRVRSLGRLLDIELLYRAADIYVDSYPGASLTSVLDAGLHGLPIVSYAGPVGRPPVTLLDGPGFGEDVLLPRSLDEWRAVLSRWISDAPLRQLAGERTKAAIVRAHCSQGWRGALRQLYRHSVGLSKKIQMEDVLPRLSDPEDIYLARLSTSAGKLREYGLRLPDVDDSMSWSGRLQGLSIAWKRDPELASILACGRWLGAVVQWIATRRFRSSLE